MEKTLIVYYTNSGTAGKLAQHIKRLLPEADIDRIGYKGKNFKKHSFVSALFKMFGMPKAIEGAAHEPKEYDRLILVCPVWADMPASVMRSYIEKHREALNAKPYNMVCVSGGGEDKVSDWLAGHGVNAPAEKLSLKQKHVEKDEYNLTSVI